MPMTRRAVFERRNQREIHRPKLFLYSALVQWSPPSTPVVSDESAGQALPRESPRSRRSGKKSKRR